MSIPRELRAVLVAGVGTAFALFAVSGFAYQVRSANARAGSLVPEQERWFGASVTYTPAQVSRGQRLFGQSCAHCHADDASGDEGPDLHGLQISDRLIARTIQRGIKGEMPSFAKKHNQADIQALLAYLRALPEQSPLGGSAGTTP